MKPGGSGPVAWQAARVTEPSQDSAVAAPVTVTWTARILRGFVVSAVILVFAGLLFTSGRGEYGRRAQFYLYLSLLLTSVAIFYIWLFIRAARDQPVTLTVTYPALWFAGFRSPFVTELSRREGAMLRVSTIRRIRLLTLVRPDGSAPRQVVVEPRVLPEIRMAALAAGWAWHVPPADPEYPSGWDPRPMTGAGDVVALTAPGPAKPIIPTRRWRTSPTRLALAAAFGAIFLAIYLGLPAVVGYLITLALVAAAVVVTVHRWPARPGQSPELTRDALRLILPQGVVVLSGADPAPVELSDSGLLIRGRDGRRLCRVRCPEALPAVREVLTRYQWPFTQSHTR